MYKFRIGVMTSVVLLLLGTGCARSNKLESKDAVRSSVLQYLAGRENLNLAKMDIEVTTVTFAGNTAEADVAFKVKGSPVQAMSMHYTLRRSGENWTVEKASSSGSHPSPGTTSAPGDGIGDGRTMAAPPGQLPPGHPPINPPGKK